MKTEKAFKERYSRVNFKFQEPILDIGGNNGFFLECWKIKKATIIDLTKERNPQFEYISADISKKLPVINQKFKTIFIMETLEHLRNPLYLMAQVYDLLDEEGNCYIAVPYTKLNQRAGNLNKFATEEFDNGHVSRWKKREIVDQMEKLGFKAKVIQERRRFKNTAFWLPHCWLVLELTKQTQRGESKYREVFRKG